jgi:hypothetical protein
MNTLLIKQHHKVSQLALIAIYGVIAGYCLLSNPMVGFAAVLLPVIIHFACVNKRALLYLMLILLPFQSSSFVGLHENIMGIPGAKPYNLLATGLVVLFFFYRGRLFASRDSLEKKTMIILGIHYGIYLLSYFRSLKNLPRFVLINPDIFHPSALRYFLSFFAVPSIFVVIFIYILKCMVQRGDIVAVKNMLLYSLFPLSIAIIAVGLANASLLLSRGAMVDVYTRVFGFHYNDLGAFYIIPVPLMLHDVLQRRKFALLNYLMAFLAVCILQGRAVILVFVISSLIFMLLSGRVKSMMLFILVIVIAAGFFLPDFLLQTFSIGVESGNVNAMMSGRVNELWYPILMDRLEHPVQLLFGEGRYAYMASDLFFSGDLYQAGNVHNAFLDYMLENGLILTMLFAVAVIFFMRRAWFVGKRYSDPLYWAFYTGLIGFLASTISGNRLIPDLHNAYVFVTLPLFINYTRLLRSRTPSLDH